MKNKIPKLKYDPDIFIGEYRDIDILRLVTEANRNAIKKVIKLVSGKCELELNVNTKMDKRVAAEMNNLVKLAVNTYKRELIIKLEELYK